MTIIDFTIIVYAVTWFVYAMVMMGACAWLAKEKDRDSVTWAMLGILLGIIALIILGFSPSKRA
jgi:hypothetical protein